MKISEKEIIHVAKLARLNLRPDEVESITGRVDEILAYVAKLDELDTSAVEPTTHALSITNAFREDVVKPSLSQQEALANGPRQNGEAFVVPSIL